MRVKHLVYRDLAAVRGDSTISALIRAMQRSRESTIFVVDAQNRYLGAVSVTDIIEAGIPDYVKRMHSSAVLPSVGQLRRRLKSLADHPVADYVRPDDPVLSPEDAISYAADLMSRSGYTTLAVVDAERRLLGRISKIDILSLAMQ